MDRIIEIRLMLEGLNSQKQEISNIEEKLISEYNSILTERQNAANKLEEQKTEQESKSQDKKTESKESK